MNIDISEVTGQVYRMREVANEIDSLVQGMNYYYTGSSVNSQGDFSAAFEHMRSVVAGTAYDMKNFIQGYADLVMETARNFEALDKQMADKVAEYASDMEG